MIYTSIQISPKTRDTLAKFKSSERETYDDVLKKLMSLIPSSDDEGEYSDAFKIGILNARLDLKSGNVVPHDEVKRRLGL